MDAATIWLDKENLSCNPYLHSMWEQTIFDDDNTPFMCALIFTKDAVVFIDRNKVGTDSVLGKSASAYSFNFELQYNTPLLSVGC